ncbi:MAG: RsmB/NOP family class I SAM-dependent RNA methyltransferase [Candidatus Omnitrophica bacterium]|nr:RsmB/NOP family class I SAM-dependent RNA methyltransferase [Candidatus Omnitrophota bacterium]
MIKGSLPPDFLIRLKDIAPQAQEFGFGQRAWMSFRINTLKVGIDEAYGKLKEHGVDFKSVGFCPYAILVNKETGQRLLESKLVQTGLLYAQGLESLLPVLILDPKPHERVLDLCAAPGSKTSQIAMHMHNQGTLKANEPVRDRLYRLKAVLELTGTKAVISSVDGRRLQDRDGAFDRILVDAPCSSEGRFRIEEPKSFAYWSVRKIKEMSHKQKGLLQNAGRLLKPGGVLVYSTCTFAPEENEEVVDWFLRKNEKDFKLAAAGMEGIETYPCLSQWQKRTYAHSLKDALRVLPDEYREGFFIAKFVKSYNMNPVRPLF